LRLVSNVSGSVIRRLSFEQMIPNSGLALATFSAFLKERYKFQDVGISARARQMGVMLPGFQNGEMTFRGQATPIMGLEFAPSEISVTCVRTDISEHLITEILEQLIDTLKFKMAEKTERTEYSSTLVVEAAFPLLESLGKWATVYEMLRKRVAKDRADYEVMPLGIKFIGKSGDGFFDDATHTFAFEKRLSVLDVNWQYTVAPMSSAEHFEFLEEIEQLFVGTA
jgi:hypothetical protein